MRRQAGHDPHARSRRRQVSDATCACAQEENPFLGWRSIRVSLEMPELFKVQLRAILRASAYGPRALPAADDLEPRRGAAREGAARGGARELRREGIAFDEHLPVGIMVEVPSAVHARRRSSRARSTSSAIGTNDLIQYLLAVDRNNRKVAPLYEPLHPAVLRVDRTASQAARGAGKCGRHLRRDGGRSGLHARARRPRHRRAQHGAVLHPAHQALDPLASTTRPRARWRHRVSSMATVQEIKGDLFVDDAQARRDRADRDLPLRETRDARASDRSPLRSRSRRR